MPGIASIQIPPGFRENLLPGILKDYPDLERLWRPFDPSTACGEPQATAVAMLTVCNLGMERSFLYWVRHGVVIQKELFSKIPASVVNIQLLVNADDLAIDLSGFGLHQESALERQKQICQALTSQLIFERLDVKFADRTKAFKFVLACAAVGGAGVLLGATVLPEAAALVPMSIASYVAKSQWWDRSGKDQRIWNSLRTLLQRWNELFPDPSGSKERLAGGNYYPSLYELFGKARSD